MTRTCWIDRVGLSTSLVLSLLFLLSGCATKEHYVVASTGTVIGVEVSQNPANQTPQAKLGYNRAELAIVPSDRPTCVVKEDQSEVVCGATSGSAKAVPDVLMELRYGGIFDLGPSSSIYQRLAVGNTAVRQPGAALLFAKGPDGSIDPNAERALAAASPRADEIIRERTAAIDRIMAHVTRADGTVDTQRLGTLLDATPSARFIKDHLMAARSADDLRARFIRVSSTAVLEDIASNIDS